MSYSAEVDRIGGYGGQIEEAAQGIRSLQDRVPDGLKSQAAELARQAHRLAEEILHWHKENVG